MSLARSGIEVYKTKDTNIEETTTTTSSSSSTSSNTDDKEGFVLHNGTIKEIAYFDEMYSNSFEYDYEDISNSGSISLPEVDDTRFYKGIKILLKKAWNPDSWDDLKNCLMGFITEQSYTEDGVELKISGMSKLLEQEKQFSFTKTKRSVILKTIIESAGLKAQIDTKGLKDDKIDYTNISSTSGSSGAVSADYQQLVNEIVGSETDEYNKFEKLHNWGNKNIPYSSYECSKYNNDPDKCLSNKSKGLNCGDTSIIMCALYKTAGFDCYIIHGSYHFWVIVTINGEKYASDCSGNNGHAINKVWNNSPFSGSKVSGYNLCS